MHVKSYCFRSYRYDPPWLQEIKSSSTFVPQGACKPSRWYLSQGAPGWDAQDTDEDHHPGHRCKNAAAFIWLAFSLNSKLLTCTFLFLINKVSLKWNLRRSVRIHNPSSSQISGCLNKAPIQIQSLSLLIRSGGDRQHACQIFWFHIDILP